MNSIYRCTGYHTRRQIESSLDEEGVKSNGVYVIEEEFWSDPPTSGHTIFPRHCNPTFISRYYRRQGTVNMSESRPFSTKCDVYGTTHEHQSVTNCWSDSSSFRRQVIGHTERCCVKDFGVPVGRGCGLFRVTVRPKSISSFPMVHFKLPLQAADVYVTFLNTALLFAAPF